MYTKVIGKRFEWGSAQGWKKPVFFLKNPAQWVFLGFLVFFLGFWGFFAPDERVFRVFFSFTNTFRCTQT